MRLSDMIIEKAVLVRDGEFEALGLSNTESDKKLLSFLEDEKFVLETMNNPSITSLITTQEIGRKINNNRLGILCVENPRVAFFQLHNLLSKQSEYCRKSFPTQIGENCSISPLAYIEKENVIIGNNVTVEEFVSIRGHCVIGDDSIIKSGSQIGGSGFEFKLIKECILDVQHCGGVVIGKNVIIWPNVTIHKAVYPWDDTRIGDFVRINSNTHIDHGVKVGKLARICAGCIVSGRTEVGEKTNIGPNSVISNRIVIGKEATISLGAVVTQKVEPEERVTGNFAITHDRFLENLRKIK